MNLHGDMSHVQHLIVRSLCTAMLTIRIVMCAAGLAGRLGRSWLTCGSGCRASSRSQPHGDLPRQLRVRPAPAPADLAPAASGLPFSKGLQPGLSRAPRHGPRLAGSDRAWLLLTPARGSRIEACNWVRRAYAHQHRLYPSWESSQAFDFSKPQSWSPEDSKKLYNLTGWGAPYFNINDNGNLVVSPAGAAWATFGGRCSPCPGLIRP